MRNWRDVENRMANDDLWEEKEPQYIGECENCQEDIYEGYTFVKVSGGAVYCEDCFKVYH